MKNQIIPQQLQGQLNAINEVKPELARVQIPPHPDLAGLSQNLVVHGVVIALKQEYVKINYSREFTNTTTGRVVDIQKSSPDWVIKSGEETFMLDETLKPIQVDVEVTDDEGNITTEKDFVKVPTIKYLTFLQQNNLVGFVQILRFYAGDFVAKNAEILNK